MELQAAQAFKAEIAPLDVTIVMPCLNEVQSLPHCMANALDALDRIYRQYGLAGEVVIADNGSTDGSQALATSLGARVVNVSRKGYGAAIIGGFNDAYGRFLIMGDCDGSYDFTNAVPMIGKLLDGADLCMGSRFQGGIAPGAMPWKNRYIGNPVLTGVLNLFFRTGIDDAHCGLRAIRKDAYHALGLQGSGMEFASEMVIKASLRKLRIDQVAATLSPDLRDRAPHLRPWRDGWRHLRYLFMLSPTWAFGVPAALMMGAGALIFLIATLFALGFLTGEPPFGASWTIVGAFLITTGHFAALMALATHFYGARQGYRPLRPVFQRLASVLTLENALISGGAAIATSILSVTMTVLWWGSHGFTALPSTLPLLFAIVIGVIGAQTALGGFLLAVIAGHDAQFCPENAVPTQNDTSPALDQKPVPAQAHGADRVGRYTTISAICFVVQNVVLISSDLVGLHFEVAVLLSTAILIPSGFLLQSYFTFRTKRNWTAFFRYAAAMASNLPLSMALAWIFCGLLGWSMIVASPAISACLYIWNYISSGWALTQPAKITRAF